MNLPSKNNLVLELRSFNTHKKEVHTKWGEEQVKEIVNCFKYSSNPEIMVYL